MNTVKLVGIIILIILCVGVISEYPIAFVFFLLIGGVLSGYERDTKS